MTDDLPNLNGAPDGTLLFQADGKNYFVRRCDVCYAALLDTHDADFQEHMEWHDRTGTNVPPTA
jgi:hypothetical protein